MFGGNAKKLREATEKLQAKERAEQEAGDLLKAKDQEIQELTLKVAQMEQAMNSALEEAAHWKQEAENYQKFGASQEKALAAIEVTKEDLEKKHARDKESLKAMNEAALKAERAIFELKAMEELRNEAVEIEKRTAAALERAENEVKELREAGLRTQRELDSMRSARAEAFAKMEAAEKVVAFAKKEAFDFQRFGERAQRELEITRGAKEVLEKKIAELTPQVQQTGLELGVTRREVQTLRDQLEKAEDELAPVAQENGALKAELEQLRNSEALARAELQELQQATTAERLYLTNEASSWKDFAKRNQLEMEMYVGRKTTELSNALQNAHEPLQLTGG